MPLPTPVGRQKEVLVLPGTGHHAILGTAGSGKTTLAILRSAYLADRRTPHSGTTLLVTFNRALVTYLRHLQDRRMSNITVENYHTFARGYLNYRGKMSRNGICSPDERKALIAHALGTVSAAGPNALFSRRIEFFSEEIKWMEQHGIYTQDAYLDAERVGRRGARVERKARSLIFQIFSEYRSMRRAAGKLYDWDDLATAVSEELDTDSSPRLYRHIVIDEGQDFSPEMIRSLSKAIPGNGSLTFFADMAQQIYGRRMSWRSAGLNIGTPWNFKENYRNSKQIAKLALAISKMPYFQDISDLVEPTAPTAEGPPPTLVKFGIKADEVAFVGTQVRDLFKTQSVAVLLRDRNDEAAVTPHLPSHSIRLHRDLNTWQSGRAVYYGTYHSAKGLEFDAVRYCHSFPLRVSQTQKKLRATATRRPWRRTVGSCTLE